MRLITTFQHESDGKRFSHYLESKGIHNNFESVPERDWGSPGYGNLSYQIWVHDEDELENANRLLKEFKENPDSPVFDIRSEPSSVFFDLNEESDAKTFENPPKKTEKSGQLTFLLLFLCTGIFFYGQMTTPKLDVIPNFVPYTAVLSPPIYKKLYYDYPKAYELIDTFQKLYGFQSLENPNTIPPEGQALLNEYVKTPYWKGIYAQLEQVLSKKKASIEINAPLFEKIREGEVWRLFSPALLHSDIFHILFNMIWLIALGTQMEARMSRGQFVLFILCVAIVSNTAQYLMSGANFIGISGVLTGMLAYVWYRQRHMPWEGYQFLPSTFNIMAVFILGIAALQTVSFFTEIYLGTSISPGFANTAHIVGAIVGYVLARIPGFSSFST